MELRKVHTAMALPKTASQFTEMEDDAAMALIGLMVTVIADAVYGPKYPTRHLKCC
jgi:hypothetical protein